MSGKNKFLNLSTAIDESVTNVTVKQGKQISILGYGLGVVEKIEYGFGGKKDCYFLIRPYH